MSTNLVHVKQIYSKHPAKRILLAHSEMLDYLLEYITFQFLLSEDRNKVKDYFKVGQSLF